MGSYTDPGAIIAIVTGLVASIVAIPAYFVFYKNKFKGWIDGRRKKRKR